MNIVYITKCVSIITAICMIASCGSTRELSDKEYDTLKMYKNNLKFSTVFETNGLQVTLLNEGIESISTVGMVLHIIQANTERSLSSDLIEHVSKNMLASGEDTAFSIDLRQLINDAFGNQYGEYIVSVSYLSDKALHINDPRNLYFISYNHQ